MITREEIEEAVTHYGLFGKFDHFEEVSKFDDQLNDKKDGILKAICRVKFCYEPYSSSVLMTIYENRSARIGSSACGQSFPIIAAYGRAERFIHRIGLYEFQR